MEKNDAEIQKRMLQFQLLEGNLRAVRGQLEEVLVRAEEMSRTMMALEELENVRPGEALVPVGAGTFVKGRVADTDSILVSIGGDMAVQKTRKDTVKFIDSRLSEVNKLAEDLAAQEKAVVMELQRLQPEIQRMLQANG